MASIFDLFLKSKEEREISKLEKGLSLLQKAEFTILRKGLMDYLNFRDYWRDGRGESEEAYLAKVNKIKKCVDVSVLPQPLYKEFILSNAESLLKESIKNSDYIPKLKARILAEGFDIKL